MPRIPYLHLDVALAGAAEGHSVALSDEATHHLTRVLRVAPGAELEVADGAGWSAPGQLTAGGVQLLGAARHRPVPHPRLVLAQGLPKGRKLDEVLRQATELGVDEIRVLATQRSVPMLPASRAAKATTRWEAVVRAACEQARRPHRPQVTGPLALHQLARDDELLLVAHPGAPGLPTVAEALVGPTAIVLAVGPEGGFSDDEVADAVAGGALAVGLGDSVLRTEHAGAAGLAVLAAGVGRWGAR